MEDYLPAPTCFSACECLMNSYDFLIKLIYGATAQENLGRVDNSPRIRG